MDANRDIQPIQTGGGPETLAALMSGGVEAAAMTAPADVRAVALGYRMIVNGPESRIPYAATSFVARRSLIAKRDPVFAKFMRIMGEASRILHSDKEFVYKGLGKYLRVSDTKLLDAAYQSEIPALERRLEISARLRCRRRWKRSPPGDARAKTVKLQELIDRRYLRQLEKSGVFDK